MHFRIGDFKLIAGYPGPFSGWYPPDRIVTNVSGSNDQNKYQYFTMDDKDYPEHIKSGNESFYKLFNLKGNINYEFMFHWQGKCKAIYDDCFLKLDFQSSG